AAELLDRPLGHVRRQGLAVPTVLVLDLRKALAFDRLGDDHRRLAGVRERLPERAVDGSHIVAVDHDGEAAERLDPAPVDIEGPAEFGLAALTQAVDVTDSGQVRELVVARIVERLPDLTCGDVRVAAENPDVMRALV